MRNPLKILHVLFVVGMIPLLVYSGFPTVGCACETATAEAVACCCHAGREKNLGDRCSRACCRQADGHGETRTGASIRPIGLSPDLGLLPTCECRRGASPKAVAIQSERRAVDEDAASPGVDSCTTLKPSKPLFKLVVESHTFPADSDRVLLFCALLI